MAMTIGKLREVIDGMLEQGFSEDTLVFIPTDLENDKYTPVSDEWYYDLDDSVAPEEYTGQSLILYHDYF